MTINDAESAAMFVAAWREVSPARFTRALASALDGQRRIRSIDESYRRADAGNLAAIATLETALAEVCQ